MHLRSCGAGIVIHAPAKINLFLEILARRDDGFHELETLMTTIDIYDTIYFASTNGDSIQLDCTQSNGWQARANALAGEGLADGTPLLYDVPQGVDNLVWRAVKLLQDRSGVQKGANVRLIKRIPSQAGLGGASSDAAAALIAANQAWNLGWSAAQLAELSAELGSDIPFFFFAPWAVCRGRGERVETIRQGAVMHLVVVWPDFGLSTPAVFGRCQVPEQPSAVEGILAALQQGNAASIGRQMCNRLQAPARELEERLEEIIQCFDQTDCLGHQLSGSGTSYFGICRSARHARRVANRLKSICPGLVFATRTAA